MRICLGPRMRRLLASAVLTGLALALPTWAFAQAVPMPVIPALKPVHTGKATAKAPVWQQDGNKLSVMARGGAGSTFPSATAAPLVGKALSGGAGVKFPPNPALT